MKKLILITMTLILANCAKRATIVEESKPTYEIKQCSGETGAIKFMFTSQQVDEHSYHHSVTANGQTDTYFSTSASPIEIVNTPSSKITAKLTGPDYYINAVDGSNQPVPVLNFVCEKK